MKSLKESLFDGDLVTKSIPIDRDGLISLFRDAIGKHSNMKNWRDKNVEWNGWDEKNKWKVFTTILTGAVPSLLWINKHFDINPEWITDNNTVGVRITTGISADGFVTSPYITFTQTSDGLDPCNSDSAVSARWISRKINGVKIDRGDRLSYDSDTAGELVDMIVNIFDFFTSNEGEKLIRKEIDAYYKNGRPIPPLVLDQVLMKKAINSL